jgi:two-component system chemotaxis response regulator CheY
MSKTALVVDDSISMRQMVSFTLREAGFEVIEAGNGQEALDRLKGQKLSVIITDLNMPVLDGIGFIKQVRARPGYKFTPILMLTTEAQQSRKAEGRSAGATGWLVKPFDPKALLATLARVVP